MKESLKDRIRNEITPKIVPFISVLTFNETDYFIT